MGKKLMKNRRNEITGLRGLSACAIAYIFHYTELFHTMPERFYMQKQIMGFLARYSVCMSEIFFMLSGVLLYWTYQKRVAEGEISFQRFLFPKMKKIYPMMMASALVTWILQRIGHSIYGVYLLHPDGAEVRNSLKALMVSLMGFQTGWISDNDTLAVNGPSWFISVFFVCYGIYYLITRYVRNEWGRNLCYLGMALLGIYLMICPVGIPLLYCTSGRGYFSFFTGVLLAQGMDLTKERGRAAGCVAAAIVLLGSVCLMEQYEHLRNLWTVSLFLWTSLIYLVCQVDILRKVFGWKPFVWLGDMCMPIFLWNMATDVAMELLNRKLQWNLDYGSLKVWCIHVAVSLLVVWLMNGADVFFMRFVSKIEEKNARKA